MKISRLTIVIILVILFFGGLQLSAQAPGYQGKRVFLEGQLGGNIGLGTLSYNNYDEPYYPYLSSLNPNLSLNYVSNRNEYFSIRTSYLQYSENRDSLLTFPSQPALEYRIKVKSVALGYYKTKKKSGSSLAPLGRYIGGQLIYSKADVKPVSYADTGDKFEGEERAAYYLLYQMPKLEFFNFAITFGSRTILKDKFTLNYALDMGFPVYTIEQDYKREDGDFAYDRAAINQYKSFYFNLSIGTGILLF